MNERIKELFIMSAKYPELEIKFRPDKLLYNDELSRITRIEKDIVFSSDVEDITIGKDNIMNLLQDYDLAIDETEETLYNKFVDLGKIKECILVYMDNEESSDLDW